MFPRSLALACALAACGDGHQNTQLDAPNNGDAAQTLPHTLFVAREGTLASFDLASGQERPGEVSNVTGPVDLQVLDDGTIAVDLTGANQVLFVDPFTMLEKARIASSGLGGTRPVHDFISPKYNGKQFLAVMNDGTGADDSTASLIDIAPTSPTYLKLVGEVKVGVGHHKATFSATKMRMLVSNIGDCNNVMSVYDFTNPASITSLATLTAAQAGWTAADPGTGFDPKFCDPTYAHGLPPAPHGCTTSPMSGKAYSSLTSSGDIVVVDIDAATPTFTIKPTNGSGAGVTHMHPGGRYAYTMEATPREGMGGTACQIGQFAVTDTTSDTVVDQVGVKYKGATCTDALAMDEDTNEPGYYRFSKDGNTMFVSISGGYMDSTARVRYTAVFDTTDPAAPVQLASIPTATQTEHGWITRDGTGQHVYVVGSIDGAVTEIDTVTKQATRTLSVGANPLVLGTYGTAEGGSEQVGPVND